MFSYSLLIFGLLIITLVIFCALKLKVTNFRLIAYSFAILLLAMLIFDSYLTALPIVEYNKSLVLGWHLGSIPIEDFGYLIVVVILAPSLFEYFNRKGNSYKKSRKK